MDIGFLYVHGSLAGHSVTQGKRKGWTRPPPAGGRPSENRRQHGCRNIKQVCAGTRVGARDRGRVLRGVLAKQGEGRKGVVLQRLRRAGSRLERRPALKVKPAGLEDGGDALFVQLVLPLTICVRKKGLAGESGEDGRGSTAVQGQPGVNHPSLPIFLAD